MTKTVLRMPNVGTYWESQTKSPIPLGAIVVRRDVPDDVKMTLSRLLKKSIEYANAHPMDSYAFIHEHAQAIEDDVLRKHIALFVNAFSLSLG